MTARALAGRLQRLEMKRGVGEVRRLSDEAIRRRIDDLRATLPADIRAELEQYHEVGDIVSELAAIRRLMSDKGGQVRGRQ